MPTIENGDSQRLIYFGTRSSGDECGKMLPLRRLVTAYDVKFTARVEVVARLLQHYEREQEDGPLAKPANWGDMG